jgi:MOSC domain-containing protein YiiM
VLIEITSYTTPCRTIMRAFTDRAYGRVSQARHPGSSRVYARVLADGVIAAGDPVRFVESGAVGRSKSAIQRIAG